MRAAPCVRGPAASGRGIRPGPCHAGPQMHVAAIVAHRGEEPPLVKGAAPARSSSPGVRCSVPSARTDRSATTGGAPALSPSRLADYLLDLERMGCSNINLVSATHFAPALAETLSGARRRGLSLPVVLNSERL